MTGPNGSPRLAMPASAQEPELQCFFVFAAPAMNSMGQVTGMALQRPRCGAHCALYDREKNRPCLTAMREDIVAAIRAGVPVPGS